MILNGKKIRDKRKKILREKVSSLDIVLKLAILQVGSRKDSESYIKNKVSFGKDIGILVLELNFDEDVTEEELIEKIEKLNVDKTIHGIILQLPIPSNLDSKRIIATILKDKDVDGLVEESEFTPATTKGIITLLEEYDIEVNGREVLVIGQSELVGKPTAQKFEELGANVSVADIKTEDLKTLTKAADIIVSAAGQSGLITKEHVKEGQVIIDVGINFIDGKLVGDVLYDEVSEIVEAISPVPGGVGPMTVLSLFENLVSKY